MEAKAKMKTMLKYLVAAAFVVTLLVGGIALSMSGVQYVTAQDNNSNQPVCQSEGSLAVANLYAPLNLYARVNSLTHMTNLVGPGSIQIGECASTSAPNSVEIYQWVQVNNGYVGYAKQSELRIAMQPPVTATLVPSMNNGGNETLNNAVVDLGDPNSQCQFREGFTAAQQALGLPSNALRGNGSAIEGPFLWINTTSGDIVSVAQGFKIIHAGQTVVLTGGVYWLYDGDLTKPGLQDCNVEKEYGYAAPKNP